MSNVLHWFYGLTGDWGIAIILLAVVLRLILLPVSLRQKLDFQKSKELGVESKKIREKYKDNKEKVNRELAKLYKAKGMNMGSCFLLLLQLPVFWGVFNAVKGIPADSDSFLLPWISSLSLPDPILIVPILAIFFQLLPQMLSFFSSLKGMSQSPVSVPQLLLLTSVSAFFLIKLPASVALYWFGSAVIVSAQELITFLLRKA